MVTSVVYAGQIDLLNCEYDPPTRFDTRDLLTKLYGKHFSPHDKSGHGNIVVLGAHNSGTSMVTRLIMLLGAFAGNFETISIHRHNKLKYYEQFSVSLFHDAFLGKFVDTRFRPYHGQGLNLTDMSTSDVDKLNVRFYSITPFTSVQRMSGFVCAVPLQCACIAATWADTLVNAIDV